MQPLISQLAIKTYAVAVAVFFLIDLTWLGSVAKGVYAKYMGHLLRATPNWPAAISFYLIFVVGLVYFAILPAVKAGDWSQAIVNGALFGFFAYLTFDMTGLAVLKDWPWQIVIVDIVWGTALAGTVAAVTYQIIVKYLSA